MFRKERKNVIKYAVLEKRWRNLRPTHFKYIRLQNYLNFFFSSLCVSSSSKLRFKHFSFQTFLISAFSSHLSYLFSNLLFLKLLTDKPKAVFLHHFFYLLPVNLLFIFFDYVSAIQHSQHVWYSFLFLVCVEDYTVHMNDII